MRHTHRSPHEQKYRLTDSLTYFDSLVHKSCKSIIRMEINAEIWTLCLFKIYKPFQWCNILIRRMICIICMLHMKTIHFYLYGIFFSLLCLYVNKTYSVNKASTDKGTCMFWTHWERFRRHCFNKRVTLSKMFFG